MQGLVGVVGLVTVVLVGVGEGRARTDTLRVWVWETVCCAGRQTCCDFRWWCETEGIGLFLGGGLY